MQSDTLDLGASNVTVEVFRDGQPVALTPRALLAFDGSRYGIGWTYDEVVSVEPGHTWDVTIRGDFPDIDYRVETVDCAL